LAQTKRFAAKRKTSTEPDATTTKVMLSMLRAAVDSTIGKRAAGAADLARPYLDFDRFLVAMMNPQGGVRLHMRPDPNASLPS
jgi:hypothetical protein